MKYFNVTIETCPIGFHEHVNINHSKSIDEQLNRRRLHPRRGPDTGNPDGLKKIIATNSSLRVDFGWSFESLKHYETIMEDCIDTIFPHFDLGAYKPFGHLTTDLRCSWLGFVPFDIFEQDIFDRMSIPQLIFFNNELITFQSEVVKFITQHKIYKQHSLLRNYSYKFDYFKQFRKDPDALTEAYNYYMEAIRDACLLTSISRDLVEMEIGCHFLYHPDLFFQLLDFSILQGMIYD